MRPQAQINYIVGADIICPQLLRLNQSLTNPLETSSFKGFSACFARRHPSEFKKKAPPLGSEAKRSVGVVLNDSPVDCQTGAVTEPQRESCRAKRD